LLSPVAGVVEIRDNESTEQGGNAEPSCSHERLDAFGCHFSVFLSPKSFRASTDAIYGRQ